MREYAKVSPGYWTGETGHQLKEAGTDALLLGLYLLTNPHATMLGVYYLPLAYVATDLGWLSTPDRVLAAMHQVKKTGFCRYGKTSWVWVVEMARLQMGPLREKDNRRATVKAAFASMPRNPHREDFWTRYHEEYGLDWLDSWGPLPKGLPRGYEGVPKGSATPPEGVPSPNGPKVMEMETEMEMETDSQKGLDGSVPIQILESEDRDGTKHAIGAPYPYPKPEPPSGVHTALERAMRLKGRMRSYALKGRGWDPVCTPDQEKQLADLLCQRDDDTVLGVWRWYCDGRKDVRKIGFRGFLKHYDYHEDMTVKAMPGPGEDHTHDS